MAIPQDREQLLQAIDSNFNALNAALDQVPLARVDERSLEGHVKGTQISVSELVAYLLGWSDQVLEWLDKDLAGRPIAFPAEGFKWNELGRLAQKFYRDYEAIPYPQRRQRLDAARQRIVSLIQSRDNAALYQCPWYGKWTLGRMIQLNTAAPYANARGRVRKWLRNTSSTPPHA
ncbi:MULTISPECIES: ClbS/DfsB family four-helix bundle protein [Pseudomonas]|uniref:ClbS/DfsB family four-helix bundle protein n=1 Tax=Pseudomonas sp. W17 TaxID=3144407 RepID=A0AAU7WLT6_9PSED|nr:ClbS/DfsB family four-helix bundle protein [Pseudomonas protegens]MCD9568951.1 ClbS/DfsB family four-helix bundle protein [Pseudomonas protegens]